MEKHRNRATKEQRACRALQQDESARASEIQSTRRSQQWNNKPLDFAIFRLRNLNKFKCASTSDVLSTNDVVCRTLVLIALLLVTFSVTITMLYRYIKLEMLLK